MSGVFSGYLSIEKVEIVAQLKEAYIGKVLEARYVFCTNLHQARTPTNIGYVRLQKEERKSTVG